MPDCDLMTARLTADFQFHVDIGTLAHGGHDVTQQLVTLAQDRIDQCTDTDQTTRYGELQIVSFGKQRNDSRLQGLADELAGLIGKHLSGTDLDFLTNLEYTTQDTSTSDTTLELVYG